MVVYHTYSVQYMTGAKFWSRTSRGGGEILVRAVRGGEILVRTISENEATPHP